MLIKKHCEKPINVRIDSSIPFDKERIFIRCTSYEVAKEHIDFSRNQVLFTDDGYVVFQKHIYKYIGDI